MWDLRWVLAGLGALLLIGVYLASKGLFRRASAARHARARNGRQEPSIDAPQQLQSDYARAADDEPHAGGFDADERDAATELAAEGDAYHDGESPKSPAKRPKPAPERAVERVIALRLVPRTGDEISTESAVLALRALRLRHGRYGIFHHLSDGGETRYSVASLTEPGSFDLTKLVGSTIAGLSVFMVLPGRGDPVERFDMMIATARDLAQTLDADLLDERGSSWSIQRERYIREEIIEYRYQLEHA
jgi:cell division protein ZipA